MTFVKKKTVFVAEDGSEHNTPDEASRHNFTIKYNTACAELFEVVHGCVGVVDFQAALAQKSKAVLDIVEFGKILRGEVTIRRRGRKPGSKNKPKIV
jgi:hypothetical protein